MTTTSSMTSSDLKDSLEIIEIKRDLRFSVGVLREILPDVETALFFGKVYDLDYQQLSLLLSRVLNTDLAWELTHGDHSVELQGYVLEPHWLPVTITKGDVSFKPNVPTGEILPELWKAMEVEVAQSIKDVAAKLHNVVGRMPGKQGSMVFSSMMKLNLKRPTLGDYRAQVRHERQRENLVILDVSGSMTRTTVEKIVDDVVALSYVANAHMAVVSNTTTHWDPGTYETADVLRASEFGGTQYETLAPLLDEDWGVVVSIADYDSSQAAKDAIAWHSKGSIEQVLDISLVNKPTFLAECVGQLAKEVKPLLIANTPYVLED